MDVEILIIDEADRMFDMGFINDVKRIIARIPKDRQTLLFSRQYRTKSNALARSILRDPKRIDVGEQHNPVDTVETYDLSYPAGFEGRIAPTYS